MGRCGHRPLQSLRLLLTEQPPPFSREACGRTMFAPTVRPFWFGKRGKIVEKGWWFNGWKGDGAMWASPPTIPLSPAVTSLTEPSPLSLRDISPHCGESPFSRGTRDSSALTGTSSIRGGSGERCSPLQIPPALRATSLFKGGFRVWGRVWVECSVPGNRNSPEGGTGSLSAVRKIVFLRWIGG